MAAVSPLVSPDRRVDEISELRPPQGSLDPIPQSVGIAEGVKLLRASRSCVAVEVPKSTVLRPSLLNAYVTDSPEFSVSLREKDSRAFRDTFDHELKQHGFPEVVRTPLIDTLQALFEDLRGVAQESAIEAFLILRRARKSSHWHIDHYRPESLQFVTTLAGYPTTPFLLPGDYNQGEFEHYRSLISRRELDCRGLSPHDAALSPLKEGMNRLAEGQMPRFVRGGLLFKGDELFHATPKSSVSRLIFAMSAVSQNRSVSCGAQE